MEHSMNKRLSLWAVAAGLIFGLLVGLFAAEPNSGKEMYSQYCGSCHGRDGKGNGTVSREMKVKVPDLTVLARKNKGVYPLDDVMATIDGRRFVRAHGDRDMPVWGEAFHSETEGKKYGELTTLLKAKMIAEYVGSLQRK
jgi:mono/diheme cytochrome c family protein